MSLFVFILALLIINTDYCVEYNSIFVIPETNIEYPAKASYKLKKWRRGLYSGRSGQYYLVGRKAAKKHKGMWTLIGGKRESYENDPIETAKREFAEETLGTIQIDLNQNNISNIYDLKDLKKIAIIAHITYDILIYGIIKFYKNIEKEKNKTNSKQDIIEIYRLALINTHDLSVLLKNKSNWLKALVFQPNGSHKVEKIELRSSAAQILRKIAENK